MRLLIGAMALAAATGCETTMLGDPQGPTANYAEGSVLGSSLTGRQQAALQSVFVRQMASGAAGAPAGWASGEANGEVTVFAVKLGDVTPTPATRPRFGDERLELSFPVETELGEHVLTRNSNMRTGPGTDYPVIATLDSGTGVDVLGRVTSAPWMLVAVEGTAAGYVHSNLMTKAPGREFDLAGGPVRRPVKCRAFKQRLSLYGRTDIWEGSACLRNGTWVLDPRAENAPTRLF